MTTLLPLPGEGELILTEAEVKRITGAGTPKLQLQWLQDNGWAHTVDRHGAPVVGRLYANLKLGGLDMATMVQGAEWQPDTSAITA